MPLLKCSSDPALITDKGDSRQIVLGFFPHASSLKGLCFQSERGKGFVDASPE